MLSHHDLVRSTCKTIGALSSPQRPYSNNTADAEVVGRSLRITFWRTPTTTHAALRDPEKRFADQRAVRMRIPDLRSASHFRAQQKGSPIPQHRQRYEENHSANRLTQSRSRKRGRVCLAMTRSLTQVSERPRTGLGSRTNERHAPTHRRDRERRQAGLQADLGDGKQRRLLRSFWNGFAGLVVDM